MVHRKSRVTMKQIAEDAGVSIGAVSAAINGTKSSIGVSEATRARIAESVQRLGYTVNAQARSLRLGRTHQIGAILEDITLPFLANLVCHTGRRLLKHGYSLLLFDCSNMSQDVGSLVDVCYQNRVDAVLLAIPEQEISNEDILALEAKNEPVLLVERPSPAEHIRSIRMDNEHGGQIAIDHLVEQGCRRIALITNPTNQIARDRLRGSRTALAAHQLEEVALVSGNWSIESGHKVTAQLLASLSPRQRPDAIFAFNDSMAIGAMRAIRDAGLQPGGDIAVIGFDDISLAAFGEPPLTTIRQPVEQMGIDAAALLLDAIGHPHIDCPERHILCQPTLVIRESSRLRRKR